MQFFHVGIEICVKEISAVHCAILYHLCNLVKREKHPWESVAFSKVTGLNIIQFLGMIARCLWFQVTQPISHHVSFLYAPSKRQQIWVFLSFSRSIGMQYGVNVLRCHFFVAITLRSNHRRCSIENVFLKTFKKIQLY